MISIVSESIMNSAALVPVCLIPTAVGRPQRFALICAPIDEDFMNILKLSKGESGMQIIEQPRISSTLKPVFGNKENKEDLRNEVSNNLILIIIIRAKSCS